MWILEIPESAEYKLQHHRYLLPPGTTITIGRHESNPSGRVEKNFIDIDRKVDKSISRKNTVITVAEATQGAHKDLEQRSCVTIKDTSKYGTYVNGSRYRGSDDTCVVTESRNAIKCGKFTHAFNLYWEPVVLTFLKGALSSTDEAEVMQQCDAMDIKAFNKPDKFIEETTHVVSKFVSVPRVLQAILKGTHVVSRAFVSTMFVSKGEMHLDMQKMPQPVHFPPDDPLHRPNLAKKISVAPDSEAAKRRATLFEGLEFLFVCQNRYEKLSPVFEQGGGKCTRFEGPITLDALAAFVQPFKKPIWVDPMDITTGRVVFETAERTCTEYLLSDTLLDIILSDGTHSIFRAGPAIPLMEPIPVTVASSQLPVPLSGMPPPPTLPLLSSQVVPATCQADGAWQEEDLSPPPPARPRPRGNAWEESLARSRAMGSSQSAFVIPGFTSSRTRDGHEIGVKTKTVLANAETSRTKQAASQAAAAAASKKTPARQATLSDYWTTSQATAAEQSQPQLDSPVTFRTATQASPRKPAVTEEIEEVEESPVYAPAAEAFSKKRAAAQSQGSGGEPAAKRTARAASPECSQSSQTQTQKRSKHQPSTITTEEVVQTLEKQKDKLQKAAARELQAEEGSEADEEVMAPAPVVTFQIQARPAESNGAKRHRGYWDPRWEGRANFKRFRPKGDATPVDDEGDAGHYSALDVHVLLVPDVAKDSAVGMRDLDWLERETREEEEEDEPDEQTAQDRRNKFGSAGKKADPLAFNHDFDEADAEQSGQRSDDEEGGKANASQKLFNSESEDEQPAPRTRRQVVQESEEEDLELLNEDDFVAESATARPTPSSTRQRKKAATASQSYSTAKSRQSTTAASTSKRATRTSKRASPKSTKSSQTLRQMPESIVLSSDDDEPLDRQLKFRF